MNRQIEMLSLKLADGARIVRFTEPASGVSLEKTLDPNLSVAQQTARWRTAFLSFLERETGATG